MSRLVLAVVVVLSSLVQAQQPSDTKLATEADHSNMMEQLGITVLRPGPSGNESAPNHANTDEALANPYPNLPDPLTLKNGKKVTTEKQWWTKRRPEIVEDFEREVIGRVPRDVPKVAWRVTDTAEWVAGTHAVKGRQLVGHVDNTSYPAITVDIQMTVVTPVDARGPVPLMIMFRWGSATLDAARGVEAPVKGGFTFPPPPPGSDPPGTEQLIAAGWGYALLNPTSVQADNGAGLTKGIIGLVNKGHWRKPDDWGALRAWAWGASRALDYLQTDATVDGRHVGIDGVSRYGKAALITMAFDSRFAMVLVGSSGEGGAKLHRRNFGEAVENLTGSGEYHWMAGNFLKYGTAESKFGSMHAGDLPVDAHELIALCAPRLTFISYGVPEKGDAKWLDQQGSYMAAVAAQPVFRLLGAKDMGVPDDYRTAKMPEVNTGLLDGQLAWRQHDGGHTDLPNWRYFISWADTFIGHTPTPSLTSVPPEPADVPAARTDQNSMTAHAQLIEKAKAGGIDVYFLGDSITRRWGATDYPELLANWKTNFHGWNAGNFGWGGDKTQHILWRIQNGELDGVNPKVIVVLAGTNNVGAIAGDGAKVADITRGVAALVAACREKAPGAIVIVMGIFPRNDNMTVLAEIARINENLAKLADGKAIRYLDLNDRLADSKGVLVDGVANDKDKLHLTLKGYQVWADGLKPILTELLGAPASTDHAPPPTGDPAAKRQ
jgi:(4-O-methyl)-D-glucuronate---lignin esterase